MIAEIPSIWREELWHPLSVHLPIITLFLSSLAAIISLVVKHKNYHLFLQQMVFVLLTIGVMSGWLAIYTGELAYNIEVRKLCDPKVLQDHESWGYYTVIAYSVALSLLIMSKIFTHNNLMKAIKSLCVLLLIAALAGLLYTGHLGASLVYQQGAGTYSPSEDCIEFVQ